MDREGRATRSDPKARRQCRRFNSEKPRRRLFWKSGGTDRQRDRYNVRDECRLENRRLGRVNRGEYDRNKGF